MTTTNISLLFEFEKKQVSFQNPITIYQAHSLSDVLPMFEHVQKAVDDGYYAAGYVSYEAAPAFDSALQVNQHSTMPLLWFGIFEKADERLIHNTETEHSYKIGEWTSDTSAKVYEMSIKNIKQQIEEGNTYQVNYTMRLHAPFEGNDYEFYNKLSKAQNANYNAYLNTGTYRILSASPELFFHYQDGLIKTKPMKGTVKRGNSVEEDQKQAEWLYHSEKNRAENVMIVDLLRNDLGSIAKAGTVSVKQLFEIEPYPTVWQMTSTITAETKPDTTLIDLFRALFPCGSITGAPKISTTGVIADLETSARDVYCGAIGYITPKKEAIFNVPIRTVIIDTETNTATYGVGGGITWDSEVSEEYDEAFLKAKLLTVDNPEFQLLETIKLKDATYDLLDKHLTRLERSAKYFGYSFPLPKITDALNKLAEANNQGTYKVRLLLDQKANVTVESEPLKSVNKTQTAVLANQPLKSENRFLYHKTTNRDMYHFFKSQHPNFFDVLLWNEKEELTEFTTGNVVLKINDQWVTPPVSSGLLAGTFRNELLEKGVIKEQTLKTTDLEKASEVWYINSVRGWIEIDLQS